MALSEQQKQSIGQQLIRAGYTDPDKLLETAHRVFAGIDRVERDGISMHDGQPNEAMFSILLFVDKGQGDYQHFSTRASRHWPSPILPTGVNRVVEEYHADNGGIPRVEEIKNELMILVDRQNRADEMMLREPLKSDLKRLGIPDSTQLLASGAWNPEFLSLEAIRDIRLPETERDVRLKMIVIVQLPAGDSPLPFIGQVSVTHHSGKRVWSSAGSELQSKLRYHYLAGPIPDIQKIENDVAAIYAREDMLKSINSQKTADETRKPLPLDKSPKKRHRPRH